nr:hypothetical protein CR513_50306 [Ipomoea trifida]
MMVPLQAVTRWGKPRAGWLKLNVDAVIDSNGEVYSANINHMFLHLATDREKREEEDDDDASQGILPSAGSADSKFAMCAADASKPSKSSGPSSDSSPTSNPET